VLNFQDRLDIEVNSHVWGPTMSDSWQGFITDSAAHLLSFSMPTQIHDFDNHSRFPEI
jgi:hypothetical protein